MADIVLYGAASAAYAALALWFWSTRWRASPARAGLSGGERTALLVPLALHAWLLSGLFFFTAAPRFGFAFALSATVWLALVIYWCESFFVALESVQPVALGLAALVVPLSAWFPGRVPSTTSLEFRIHLLLAILAYGVLLLAMLHALLMALADQLLHGRHRLAAVVGGALAGPLSRLPPLLTLERLLFRLIAAAFVLLTATLATGMALSDSLFGRSLRFNHETVFSLIAWVVFAILLAGRRLRGWRGRSALRWALAGFTFVILANIGTAFVLEVILRRA